MSQQIQISQGQTLSQIAQQYGTSVNDIVAANANNPTALPDPSNPNLILAGGTLNLPSLPNVNNSGSAVFSSQQANQATGNAINTLNQVQTNQQNNQQNQPNNNFNLEDILGDEPQDYLAQQNAVLDNIFNTQINMLDAYSRTLDEQTRGIISNIQNMYARRKEQQKVTNEVLRKGTVTAGIRSGRSRYATEVQDGIIAAEESAGISRLADLDAEEQSLILQAQQAKTEKDFELMTMHIDALTQNHQQKQKQIMDLYQLATEAENLALRKAQNAREEFSFMQEQADTIAFGFFDQLNGVNDDEIITNAAATSGLSEDMLRRSVMTIRQEQNASLPALAKEYEYAVSNGYSGSFIDYQNMQAAMSRAASGKGTGKLTAEKATAFGLPSSMVGMTEEQVFQDMLSSTPPSWFNTEFFVENMDLNYSPDPATINQMWNEYRQTYIGGVETMSQFNQGFSANNAFKESEDDILSQLLNTEFGGVSVQ